MFRRVRESISTRAQEAVQSNRRKRITRRRLKQQPSSQSQTLTPDENDKNQTFPRSGSSNHSPSSSSHHYHGRRRRSDFMDSGSGDGDDNMSVHSTITVETTRTDTNENRKILADPSYQPPTLVFVAAPTVPSVDNDNDNNTNSQREQHHRQHHRRPNQNVDDDDDDPVEILREAQSDITKSSIYLKDLSLSRAITSHFLALVRGDNRTWEAVAVDILRQKARWESITIDGCHDVLHDNNSNAGNHNNTSIQFNQHHDETYLDTILGMMLNIDNCAFVHLSNIVVSHPCANCFRSLAYSKSLTKLQLDMIDLGSANGPTIPLLAKGLIHNTSLKCLIASRCGLDDDALQVLLSHLPFYLEELRIFGNKCRGKGLGAISTVLQHSQHLKILDLSYQHISGPEDGHGNELNDEFDIAWMAGVLHHNKVLKVLDLDNDGIDDGHLTHICAALCVNDTLEEIMLNHNRITTTGIALLASKFGEMRGLKKISMYSNLFDAPAVNGVVNSGLANQQSDATPKIPTHIAAEVESVSAPSSPLQTHDEESFDDEITILEDEIEEETVIEEVVVDDEEDDDDDDDDDDGSMMSNDSSTPPPSADFREPEEVEADQNIVSDDDEDGNVGVEEDTNSSDNDDEGVGGGVDEDDEDEGSDEGVDGNGNGVDKEVNVDDDTDNYGDDNGPDGRQIDDQEDEKSVNRGVNIVGGSIGSEQGGNDVNQEVVRKSIVSEIDKNGDSGVDDDCDNDGGEGFNGRLGNDHDENDKGINKGVSSDSNQNNDKDDENVNGGFDPGADDDTVEGIDTGVGDDSTNDEVIDGKLDVDSEDEEDDVDDDKVTLADDEEEDSILGIIVN